MNGMMEYDDTLEPDADAPCLYCDHWHDPEISCEQNRREERLQAAIEKAEERYKERSV